MKRYLSLLVFSIFYCNLVNSFVLKFSKLCKYRGIKLSESDEDTEENLGYQSEDFKSGFVSILGNPNVGKSSLMNEFLGQKLVSNCKYMY